MNTYHIHITTPTSVEGFKKTDIVLEKGSRAEEDTMWTKTVSLSGTVIDNIFEIQEKYQEQSHKRFKIEVLNQPQLVNKYTPECYREVHIKTIIPNDTFDTTKNFLLFSSHSLNYSLSNNPKERDALHTTQFLNMRFLYGDYTQSQKALDTIINMLKTNDILIGEVKDELTVYDSNFEKDSWWAH